MATVPTLPLLVLVDDAPEIGVIVKHLGVRAGQDVRVYEDVAGAWDFLTRARPDLLIVDLNLSGENGLVLCRRVRATPAFTQLAVALFTNWDRPEDVIAGLEAGVNFMLSKELLCRPENWQARIQELLLPIDSRPYQQSLSWTEETFAEAQPAAWTEALNTTLRAHVVRRLGPEISQVLLRRALAKLVPDNLIGTLAPTGLSLDPALPGRRHSPELVARIALALAEQLWCVGGSATSAPFAVALAGAIPALAGLLEQP